MILSQYCIFSTRMVYEFKGTRPMSTHLLGFMVFEFNNLTDSTKKYYVWARKNAIHDTAYAFDVGSKLLHTMETYTSIKYNLRKIDLVALPVMRVETTKSWGIISIR